MNIRKGNDFCSYSTIKVIGEAFVGQSNLCALFEILHIENFLPLNYFSILFS